MVTLVPGRAPAARRCLGPRRKRAESCRAAQIGPRFLLGQLRLAMAIPRWPRARRSSPSLPYPPGCAARAPGAGRRPAGTVPSPYSRRLSGGCHSAVTCPSPRQGSADQLITHGQARAPRRPLPLCGVLTQRLRPVVSPARSPEGAWSSVGIPKPVGCCWERVMFCAASWERCRTVSTSLPPTFKRTESFAS